MECVCPDDLEHAVELFRALADPLRIRLLSLLSEGEVCVCHLQVALALPQSTVSRHLAYLRRRGFVTARKDGLWVHYRLARPGSATHRSLLGCMRMFRQQFDVLKNDWKRLVEGRCCND